MPSTRKSKQSRNNNPRVFRKAGSKTFKFLERGMKGVGNLGVGALRLSGRVVSIGTGAANRVLGVTGRIGSRMSKRTRKTLRRSLKK